MNLRKPGLAIAASVTLLFGMFAVNTAGAITKDKAVSQAIKDEVPVYNAEAKFVKQASALASNATGAQDEAVASPFGNAISSLQSKLLDQSWPRATKNDVRKLYSVSSPLIADLATANAITSPTSASAWVSTTTTDLSVWVADVNVMNHDLGLPAFATSSSAVADCEADGATVSVALAAFHAQNPKVTPTEALLTGHADGGPYVQSWPHQSHYKFTLTSVGQLRIAAPPQVLSVPYTGPSSCAAAGV
jgi:hypothetical protein